MNERDLMPLSPLSDRLPEPRRLLTFGTRYVLYLPQTVSVARADSNYILCYVEAIKLVTGVTPTC